jgi:hypothetical protein
VIELLQKGSVNNEVLNKVNSPSIATECANMDFNEVERVSVNSSSSSAVNSPKSDLNNVTNKVVLDLFNASRHRANDSI